MRFWMCVGWCDGSQLLQLVPRYLLPQGQVAAELPNSSAVSDSQFIG